MRKLLPILLLAITQLTFAQKPGKFWDARFGGSDMDFLYKIIQTRDHGFIAVGSSSSPLSGDKTQDRRWPGPSVGDMWVVKTDSAGRKMWDKTFGGIGQESAYTVVQTDDGGYLIGGYSSSDTSADKSQMSRGGYDYWIIKIDANGTRQWDRTFGGTRDERITCIIPGNDGGYLLGGYSDSRATGDKTQDTRDTLALRTDYWVVKIDGAGNKQWDKTYGSNSHDYLRNIIKAPNGGYLLFGESYSIAGIFERTTYSRGLSDFWVVKITNTGVKQWDAAYGGNDVEVAYDAMLTSDNCYLLAGSSRSKISGEKSDSCRGQDDAWLVKIDTAGTMLWNKTIGGDGQDGIVGVSENADGTYNLATSIGSNQGGEISESGTGWYDYMLMKVSRSGSKISDYRYGGDADDYLESMTTTRDGGIILAGMSNSNIGWYKSQLSRGSGDFWIIKLLDKKYTAALSGDTLCIGSPASINYNITAHYETGNKIYLELSNAAGSFTASTVLDTIDFAGSGSFQGAATFIIPANVPAGNHYRVRMRSTSPADTIIVDSFVVKDCCPSFGTPTATNPTGELYGNNCPGESIYLIATTVAGATAYHWTGPNGFTSDLQTPVIADITSVNSGIYSVFAYNAACSSAVATVNVTVRTKPARPAVSNGGPYLAGDSIKLMTADTATVYEWTGPLSYLSSVRNPVIANATVARSGFYFLRVSNGQCWSFSDSTDVEVSLSSALGEVNGAPVISVFPNPVKGSHEISIMLNAADLNGQPGQVRIYDAIGKLVSGNEIILSSLVKLPAAQLAPGQYIIHLSSNGKLMMQKLIVE